MFEIWSKDFHIELHSYEAVKLYEAGCRGIRQDYTIKYPTGEILECKFKKTTDA